jgi:hypothetical protein
MAAKKKITYCVCKCICGNIKEYQLSNLKSNTKSCGCLNPIRKGVKPHNIQATGISTARALYTKYKRTAKSKEIYFDITFEHFLKITKENCTYCDRKPSQVYDLGNRQHNGTYTYNGVDRQDNSKGYILNNVVACCKYCNYAKSDRNATDFLNWADRIYYNLLHKGIIK